MRLHPTNRNIFRRKSFGQVVRPAKLRSDQILIESETLFFRWMNDILQIYEIGIGKAQCRLQQEENLQQASSKRKVRWKMANPSIRLRFVPMASRHCLPIRRVKVSLCQREFEPQKSAFSSFGFFNFKRLHSSLSKWLRIVFGEYSALIIFRFDTLTMFTICSVPD